MGSEGDARDNESDRDGSEFGPPLGEFGPPVADAGRRASDADESSGFGPGQSEFGPPVAGFGGPVGAEGAAQQWSTETTGDHPELVWRPAAEPETTPPPAPQYRAPDTSVFLETPSQPSYPQQPVPPEPEREQWWNTSSESAPPPTQRPGSSGLSWDDDPIARRLAPGAPVQPPRSTESGSGRRFALIGVAAVVVIAAIAAVVVFATRDSSGGGPEQTAGPPPPTASCPSGIEGKVTSGNGSGDNLTGAGAILGFNYAYYTARDGARARTFVAPDANVQPAEDLQRTIDQNILPGTTYCLRITELAPDRFNVVADIKRPNSAPSTYVQVITTVNLDGRRFVQLIEDL